MSAESMKQWRKENPEKYAYNNLKSHAKARGIAFTITFVYFLRFCKKTELIQNKGKTATSYSVDRINNDKGYVVGNLQCLTVRDNAIKGTKILRYDWQTKNAFVEDITREKTPVDFDEGFESVGGGVLKSMPNQSSIIQTSLLLNK